MSRAGIFEMQSEGYRAFIPKNLPPEPDIEYDDELRSLLSKADRNLARLDGITTVLPNPDLFIAMYVKKEALLSSQIEGTQVSLEGVLEFESDLKPKEDINEIKEVVNYIKALNYGMERINDLPMCLRLIKEIHRVLLEETRGANRNPGEFRNRQNYIGPHGVNLNEATFVPPPPNMVIPVMEELERFFYSNSIPPLVKIALIHAQFETIHPFSDGNGRIGRLLITFYLFWKKILSKPLLYLSYYLKKNRAEYYDLLMKVRIDGDWEGWIKFFLKGVSETSEGAANTAREIIKLKEDLRTKLYEKAPSVSAIKLLDILFDKPMISIKEVSERLNISKVAANTLIKLFVELDILREVTGKERYKRYIFYNFVDIMAEGTKMSDA